jgi:hypothetical protein
MYMQERFRLQGLAAKAEEAMAEVEGALYAVAGRGASWLMVVPVSVVNGVTLTEVVPEMSYGLAFVSTLALEMVGISVTSLWLDEERYESQRAKTLDAPSHPEMLKMGAIAQIVLDLALTSTLVWLRWQEVGVPALTLLAFPLVNAINTLTMSERIRHVERTRARDVRLGVRPAIAKQGTQVAEESQEIDTIAESEKQEEQEEEIVSDLPSNWKQLPSTSKIAWLMENHADMQQQEWAEIADLSPGYTSKVVRKLKNNGHKQEAMEAIR